MKEIIPEESNYRIVYLDIVHRCNMECANCYLPNRDFADLETDKILHFISRFKKPTEFRFIGGEPTLHKDLPYIIKQVNEMPVRHRTTVVTNGLRMASGEYVKQLKKAGLKTVYLSMTGFDDDEVYKITDNLACANKKIKALNNIINNKLRLALGCIVIKGLNAFLFQAPEDAYIGGVTVKMLYEAGSQTNGTGTTGLSVSIYSATGSTPTYNGMLSNQATLRYSDIVQGTNTYTLKFDSGVNITEDSFYYVMINKPESFSTGLGATSLYIRAKSGVSGVARTSIDNAGSWTGTGGSLWFEARGYLDNGNIAGDIVRKGVTLTNRVSFEPRRLSVFVPPVDDLSTSAIRLNGSATGIATTTDTTIKNDLIVYVTARNGDFGEIKTLSATVPQGTSRNTRFNLGLETDIFDHVLDVYVVPGANLNRENNGPIIWDIYDLITVETVP